MRWFLRSSGRIYALSVREGEGISLPLKANRIRHVPTPVPALGHRAHQQGWPRHGQGRKAAAVSAAQVPHPFREYQGGMSASAPVVTKMGGGEKAKNSNVPAEKP